MRRLFPWVMLHLTGFRESILSQNDGELAVGLFNLEYYLVAILRVFLINGEYVVQFSE